MQLIWDLGLEITAFKGGLTIVPVLWGCINKTPQTGWITQFSSGVWMTDIEMLLNLVPLEDCEGEIVLYRYPNFQQLQTFLDLQIAFSLCLYIIFLYLCLSLYLSSQEDTNHTGLGYNNFILNCKPFFPCKKVTFSVITISMPLGIHSHCLLFFNLLYFF